MPIVPPPKQVTNMSMSIADMSKAFYRKSLYADLTEALVSGLCVALILSIMNKADSMKPLHLTDLIKTTLWTISCFFLVVLFLHRFWQGRFSYYVPRWVLIPMLGTMLAISIDVVPMAIAGWSYPYKPEKTITEYVIRWMKDIGFFFSIIYVITIPITTVIHHLGYVIEWMRRMRPPAD